MKTMTDAMGHEVPVKYVSKYDKEKDRLVRRIHERWVKARAALDKVYAESLADFDALRALRSANGRAEQGAKGNFNASSFDGLISVGIDQSYRIMPDDRVLEARDIMLDFVRGKIEAAGNDELKTILPLIESAFKVSRAGSLSMARVMALMQVDIPAKAWQDAKAILAASIKVAAGKAYLRVDARPNTQCDKQAIRLDIAQCEQARTVNSEQ